MGSRAGDGSRGLDGFQHDAMLYDGASEFVERCVSFITGSLSADDPILVVVIPEKIDLLRTALGADADRVQFKDMAEIGRNPSRIIPVWREFIAANAIEGGRVRGIGEPIWASRSTDELVESQRHEALINVAFAGAPGWILCPYDTSALGEAVIEEAFRSHPTIVDGAGRRDSAAWGGLGSIPEAFTSPLLPPTEPVDEISIALDELEVMRQFVRDHACGLGLCEPRVSDLVLAVNELASNSVRHAGGSGTVRIWGDHGTVVCEVVDAGRLTDPLVGRARPQTAQEGGIGLWLVNQLCDLVQVRSFDQGTVVRLRMDP